MGVATKTVWNVESRNGQDDTSSYMANPAATVLDGRGIMSPEDAANPNLSLRVYSVSKFAGSNDLVLSDPQTWVGGVVNKFGDPVYPQFGTAYNEGQERPEWIYWHIDTLSNSFNLGWEAVETTPD